MGRRKYTTPSIPESVALRVQVRLGKEPLQAQLAAGHPLRVIRLRDLDAGMSKKPRNVLKLKAGNQLANDERVSETVGDAASSSSCVFIRSYTSFARYAGFLLEPKWNGSFGESHSVASIAFLRRRTAN
jgi:hypothetical protein